VAQKLARDEAGHIWDVSDPANPKFVQQGGGPQVVMPAPPKDPQFVPQHPDLVYTPGHGVTQLPGVPAAPPPAPNFVPGKPGYVVTGPPTKPQAVPIAGLPPADDDGPAKRQNAIEATRNLVQSIQKARGLVDNWSTGVGGAVLGHLPATEASQLDTIINQEIRGNIFKNWVDTLKAQTDQGTTGIGRIMQSEIPLVTGSLGALDPVKMGKKGTLDSLDQIQARVLRSAAMLNGENPDDQKVIDKYRQQFMPSQARELTPEQKAQFFDILQQQGADKADEYLSQFGQRMKDKSQANKPYSHNLALTDGSYANSYLSQALSGANEGVASVLGAPVDLTTSAINLIPKGVNAVANTNIPEISDPVAGGEWWKRRLSDVGSILPASDDPAKQFTRRVGQSVGAAAIPAGASGTAAKTLAGLVGGLGGGIGAATAQRVAPGNTLAELLGEVAGGGVTGLGLAKVAQRAAQRGIEANVPTIADLKGQASGLYRQAETRGVTATPAQTRQLAATIKQTLTDEGQLGPAGKISDADTNTSKAFNLIQQYAGRKMQPSEMNTVRKVLADSRKSSDPADQRLGSILLDQFDTWANPLAPEFGQARSVAGRYLQAQDLERARELAGARASQFTGSGFENALRTEYRSLDRNNINGNNYFNPDVVDAIEKVARGTPVSNTLRGLGRLAPTGPVSGMGSMVPAGVTALLTSPATGGAVGGTLAGAGILGRIGATRMGINAANQAELIARNGGALPQAELVPKTLRDLIAMVAASEVPKYQASNKR
jgi:hypothetical protein